MAFRRNNGCFTEGKTISLTGRVLEWFKSGVCRVDRALEGPILGNEIVGGLIRTIPGLVPAGSYWIRMPVAFATKKHWIRA